MFEWYRQKWGSSRAVKFMSVLLAVLFVLSLIWMGFQDSILGYFLHSIGNNEIGVLIIDGKYTEILGSGTYTDVFRWKANIYNVSQAAYSTEVSTDNYTVDQQPITTQISLHAFRPTAAEMNSDLWRRYSNIYRNDDLLRLEVEKFSKNTVRVCVSALTSKEAIGAKRTEFANCVTEDLTKLIEDLGLSVTNVLVLDVDLSDDAEKILNDTYMAEQQAILGQSAAEATQVYVEGQARSYFAPTKIAIEAELTRSAGNLQVIEQERLRIEAQAINDELKVQAELRLEETRLEIARIKAMQENAHIQELARIISENPAYAQQLYNEAIAQALSGVQMVYLTEGMNPMLIVGDTGLPVIEIDSDAIAPNPTITPSPTPVQ